MINHHKNTNFGSECMINLMKVLGDCTQSLSQNGHIAKCWETRYVKAANVLVATIFLAF